MRKFICFFIAGFLFFNISAFSQDSVKVTFHVHVKCNTPKGEIVSVYIQSLEGVPTHDPTSYAMVPETNHNDWRLSITNQWFYNGQTIKYKYCRNQDGGGADESFDTANLQGWRQVKVSDNVASVFDTVNKWRWWPADGKAPGINTTAYLSTPPDTLPNSNFRCGEILPDWWAQHFSPYIQPTLDEIVEHAHSNAIAYVPISEIVQYYPTPVIKRNASNGTPEKDLIKIITETHKRGLKLFLDPSTVSFLEDSSKNFHTNAWWISYEKEWERNMLYYAHLANDYGIDMLGFRMWQNPWDISPEEVPVVDSLTQVLLDTIKSIYKGPIVAVLRPDLNIKIYGKVDDLEYGFSLWGDFSRNPTLQELMKRSEEIANDAYQSHVKWGKNFIAIFGAPSYDGAASAWASEGQQAPFYPDDPSVKLDLQEQADIYEAVLRSLTKKDWIKGIYTFVSGFYWNSIDKDVGIRAKPSEKVLNKWWQWIQPERVNLIIEKIDEGGNTIPEEAAYALQKDTTVTVQAIPAEGYIFSNWEGDIGNQDSTLNPITLIMSQDKKIFPVFKKSTLGLQENHDTKRDSFLIYPNPFSSALKINYKLSKTCDVSLKVFSNDGILVRVIYDGLLVKGNHQFTWVPEANLSFGTYNIILKEKNSVSSKKVIYMR
jgi:hypothetical protein